MDLDEMQALWQDMSQELEKQKKLTDKLIIDMTQERYNNKFRTISKYESLGAVACFGFLLMIVLNFQKLDTWYLMLCGLISIAIFFILPILSLSSIYQLRRINLREGSYKDVLLQYTKGKRRFLLIQQLGIGLSFVILFTVLPIATKILDNKDIFLDGKVWSWYLPFGLIFLFFFARWGYGCYKNIANSAEQLLINELQD